MSEDKIEMTEEQKETYMRNMRYQGEAMNAFQELVRNLPDHPSKRPRAGLDPMLMMISNGIALNLGARAAKFAAVEVQHASKEDLIALMFVDGIMACLTEAPVGSDFWEMLSGYLASGDIMGESIVKPCRIFAESLLEAAKAAEEAK